MKKRLIKKSVIHLFGIAIVSIFGMSVYLQYFWIPKSTFEYFEYSVILMPIFFWFTFTYITYLFWNKKVIWKWIIILNTFFWVVYLFYTFPKIDFNSNIFFTVYFNINLLFLANTFNALEEYKDKHGVKK